MKKKKKKKKKKNLVSINILLALNKKTLLRKRKELMKM